MGGHSITEARPGLLEVLFMLSHSQRYSLPLSLFTLIACTACSGSSGDGVVTVPASIGGLRIDAPRNPGATRIGIVLGGDSAPMKIGFHYQVEGGLPRLLQGLQANPLELEASLEGREHSLAWDFRAEELWDGESGLRSGVTLIARVEGAEDLEARLNDMNVGNDPPRLLVDGVDTLGIGQVAVLFTLSDSSQDEVSVLAEYDVIDDCPDLGWRAATHWGEQERYFELPTKGEPGYAYHWNHEVDGVETQCVRLRLRPVDSLLEGRAVTTPAFLPFDRMPSERAEEQSGFETGVVMMGRNDLPYIGLVDFDADGDLDALGAATEPGGRILKLQLYENDGRGFLTEGAWSYFRHQTNPPFFSSESRIVSDDFNADGHGDFLLVNNRLMRAFLSRDGDYDEHGLNLSSGPILGVATGQFDDDSDIEFAVLQEGGARIFSVGTAFHLPVFQRSVEAQSGDSIFAFDATADGYDDLVHVTSESISLIARGGPQGPWLPANAFSVSHDLAQHHAVSGDVTGNGLVDIVLFAPEESSGYVRLVQASPGQFVLDHSPVGGPATDLADIDGDGDLDGVCCGSGSRWPNNEFPSTFHIARNEGGGVFAESFTLPGMGARHLAGAGDMDADGDVDLVAGTLVRFNPGEFQPLRPSRAPTRVDRERAVDYDGDGDVDLELDLNFVLENDGEGNMTPRIPDVETAPEGTAFDGPAIVGDFNGDGAPDMLVKHRQGQETLSVRFLANLGDGSFRDAGSAGPASIVQFATEDPGQEFHVTDLDGDGDNDLFVVGEPDVYVPASQLWYNDGDGSFTLGRELPDHGLLQLADFNNDGRLDYLLRTDRVKLWIGVGTETGEMDEPEIVSNAFNRFYAKGQIAVVDFNKDGWIDIVHVYRKKKFSSDDTKIIGLRNLGSHGFPRFRLRELKIDDPLAWKPRVFVADVSGDGKFELLFGPATSLFARDILRFPQHAVFDWDESHTSLLLKPEILVDVTGDNILDAVGDFIVPGRR